MNSNDPNLKTPLIRHPELVSGSHRMLKHAPCIRRAVQHDDRLEVSGFRPRRPESNRARPTQLNQRGMVSFLVTMVMMIVITLIVIGFSEVTRRNARETLDRQLSSQAFYAAESGINVTAATIAGNGSGSLATKTSCPNEYDPANAAGTVPIAQLSNGVRYTCVLVNPTPSNLQFSASQQDSTVLPINTNGVGIKTLTITWSMQDAGTLKTCAGATDTSFPPSGTTSGTWGADCDLGVLRLDLVQNPNTNATGYANLDNNTISLYLTPRGTHSGAKTVSFGPTTGYVVSGVDATTGSGACTSGSCKVVLTLPGIVSSYELRATTLYKASKTVTISAANSSGTVLKLYGAQAVIDVTGQDQDELRRIQARVSLTGAASQIPGNAVASSSDICKNFTILPTATIDPATVNACN